MTADFRGLRERERDCAITRASEKDFIPLKINPDLYTSWQMATESGAEITQSTVFGRVRVLRREKKKEQRNFIRGEGTVSE